MCLKFEEFHCIHYAIYIDLSQLMAIVRSDLKFDVLSLMFHTSSHCCAPENTAQLLYGVLPTPYTETTSEIGSFSPRLW